MDLQAPNASSFLSFFFFFNDTATTEIYTLSLHDALPIYPAVVPGGDDGQVRPLAERDRASSRAGDRKSTRLNSQSRLHLVCRLLLEKKKNKTRPHLGEHKSAQDTAHSTRRLTQVVHWQSY